MDTGSRSGMTEKIWISKIPLNPPFTKREVYGLDTPVSSTGQAYRGPA
jgi:hypothetical protein